ncbi:MAG: sulfite exporter TauE/SafE family protein [Frankiales bacterium]|nr:MAG: sulfite exporter TauE/SafE family protein [Frankiales bacterium]
MTPETAALLAGAGLLAGAVNALAGGGSLISFPALLAAGYPPVTANVTNTVALFPGYAGSVAGGRAELEGQGARIRSLTAVSVVGAVLGSVLLLTTPSEVFRAVVPFLILLACGLLLLQPRLAARVQHVDRPAHGGLLLQGGALLAAVYGAYFGAGLGVLLLGLLGVFLVERLQVVNALKNVVSVVVNAVAVVAFGIFGPIAWEAVLVVALASLTGGYLGGRLAGRVPSRLLRGAVVAYGVVVSLLLLLRG